jgi:phage terminase small subunit
VDDMKAPKAPAGLAKDGRTFWKAATTEREFSEAHDLRRLEMGCRTLDEIAADQSTIRAEGRYTEDRWGRAIPHPALKTLQENRALFLRVIRELALDVVAPDASRPPRLY